MNEPINRRKFFKDSLMMSAAAAAVLGAGRSLAQDAQKPLPPETTGAEDRMPTGKIGNLQISRLLLGGNLLTHYTHSRDLKYVYKLTERYNTEEKILETLALAEEHGINTLTIHVVPAAMKLLQQHRKRGGKMQWIICPTANIDDKLEAYKQQVKELVDGGTEAIYLWGVRADALASQKKMDLIARAVEAAKELGVPSGIGAHDLEVIRQCEESKIASDFYIKTLHHHNYPSAPRQDELKGPHEENPGYWCKDPQAVVDVMAKVEKPWIAFKVMAAGAISPTSGFKYALQSGADFVLAGMFDFEIEPDAKVIKGLLARKLDRTRPWCA